MPLRRWLPPVAVGAAFTFCLLPWAITPRAAEAQAAADAPAAATAPAPVSPAAAQAASYFGRRLDAPHDPWSDPAEAGAACRAQLKEAGVTFRALPDRASPDGQGCGIPHPVFVTQGPTGIRYSGPLLIDCSLALQLPDIERVIQEEANEKLGEPITRVQTLGSYSCRKKRGGIRDGLSEHAFGNAVDLASFHGKSPRAWAGVFQHYDPDGKKPPSPQGEFLRAVQRRLRTDARLTRALGPDWNAEHRDHFHLDRGRPYWWPSG